MSSVFFSFILSTPRFNSTVLCDSVHPHARPVWRLPLHGSGFAEWYPGTDFRISVSGLEPSDSPNFKTAQMKF